MAKKLIRCVDCGASFWAIRTTATCCSECRAERHRKRRKVPQEERTCQACGESFMGTARARFCTSACRQVAWRERKA